MTAAATDLSFTPLIMDHGVSCLQNLYTPVANEVPTQQVMMYLEKSTWI